MLHFFFMTKTFNRCSHLLACIHATCFEGTVAKCSKHMPSYYTHKVRKSEIKENGKLLNLLHISFTVPSMYISAHYSLFITNFSWYFITWSNTCNTVLKTPCQVLAMHSKIVVSCKHYSDIKICILYQNIVYNLLFQFDPDLLPANDIIQVGIKRRRFDHAQRRYFGLNKMETFDYGEQQSMDSRNTIEYLVLK